MVTPLPVMAHDCAGQTACPGQPARQYPPGSILREWPALPLANPTGWFSVGSNLKQPSQKTHQRAVLKWHPDHLAAIDQVYLFAELIFVCWKQECGISRNKFFSDFGFGHLVCPLVRSPRPWLHDELKTRHCVRAPSPLVRQASQALCCWGR
jgi:hypothetical protein